MQTIMGILFLSLILARENSMTTIAKSTAQSITSILGTVSTTAGVINDTVGMLGTAVNGASLKINDWHYEQKVTSIHFREELTMKKEEERNQRILSFSKEVQKTKADLANNPELAATFNELMAKLDAARNQAASE